MSPEESPKQASFVMVESKSSSGAEIFSDDDSRSATSADSRLEIFQEITELCMDALGHDSLGWIDSDPVALPERERFVASQFNYLRATTIYGGSNEVQRNVIAKQILGLPTAPPARKAS